MDLSLAGLMNDEYQDGLSASAGLHRTWVSAFTLMTLTSAAVSAVVAATWAVKGLLALQVLLIMAPVYFALWTTYRDMVRRTLEWVEKARRATNAVVADPEAYTSNYRAARIAARFSRAVARELRELPKPVEYRVLATLAGVPTGEEYSRWIAEKRTEAFMEAAGLKHAS